MIEPKMANPSAHASRKNGALSGTKAEILAYVAEAGFGVPRSVHFEVGRWLDDRASVIAEISGAFRAGTPLAVRSSCRREDSEESSMAGAFLSLLDVPSHPDPSFESSVDAVIESYGAGLDPLDQVLVQEMVRDVAMAGVVMTRDLGDDSPYYVVGYDDESGRTDSVTGGNGPVSKTVHVFRLFRNTDFDSQRLLQVVRTARQLESHLGSDRLDIEFCLDRADNIHVLQARPIGGSSRWSSEMDEEIVDKVSFVEEALTTWNRPQEGIWGRRTILGVMPDWNPAEIIGVHPRPLSASLYRDLVTRRSWSLARESMGYRALPPVALMVLLAGRPYIDVRASFNSFLPPGIPPDTGARLVDAWLDRLESHPEFHDKVEFEIAQTVVDPAFEKTYRERTPDALRSNEFRQWSELLSDLTLRCFNLGPDGSLATAIRAAKMLEEKQAHRERRLPERPGDLLARADSLLEEARILGTRPFAVIARHAFIAESFLRSAVAMGAMGAGQATDFRRSVRTISGEFGKSLRAVREGRLDISRFLDRFGHLRPGTYDILSPRYADHPESIPAGDQPRSAPEEREFAADLTDFDELLASRFPGGPDGAAVLEHGRLAIAAREWSKFVFTRNLSDAMECIARWGEHSGISREDLSWLDIGSILDSRNRPPLRSPKEWFSPLVEQGRRTAKVGQGLKLGYLIRSPRDVYVMPRHRSAPNFVTTRRVSARVLHLDGRDFEAVGTEGAIVCIRNADPGFDWLFSRGIAGLVTQFGGANSHMAIRCTEYGIPAAIGCGEQLFESVRSAPACELDAERKILRPLETP